MSAHPVTEAQLLRLHELRRQLGWTYAALRLESRRLCGADPDRLLRAEADVLIDVLVEMIRSKGRSVEMQNPNAEKRTYPEIQIEHLLGGRALGTFWGEGEPAPPCNEEVDRTPTGSTIEMEDGKKYSVVGKALILEPLSSAIDVRAAPRTA